MNFLCLPLDNVLKFVKRFTKKSHSEDKSVVQQKLWTAIKNKKWKKAKSLIDDKKADINAATNTYGEPILFAAKDLKTIRKLLELGADINTRDYSGEGILGHAILNLWSLEAIQELIKRGAFVAARNNLFVTPLERAVAVGNHEKIKLLVENGACNGDDGLNRRSESPMNYCINNFEGAKTVIKHVMLKYFEENYMELIGLENYNYPYIFKNYYYLKEYFGKCEIELQRMKTVKIGANFSLYDLLRENGTEMVKLKVEDNEELQLLLTCISNINKNRINRRIFPIYQDVVEEALKSLIKRK